jgi:hypothetical protein
MEGFLTTFIIFFIIIVTIQVLILFAATFPTATKKW